nr:MAG: hypothetical protein DIU68_00425 [Chloroflexota bacterium]
MRYPLKRQLLVLVMGALTLAACVRVQPAPEPVTNATPVATRFIPYTLVAPSDEPPPTDIPPTLPPPPTPLAEAIGPYTYPELVNPLTGLATDDPATLERRPIVAKISNAPPLVRPQAGIGQADLVFEHYAEGGLTRFSAVFYSQMPERVGSIRSARLIDNEVVPMYDALLAYSGASTGVNQVIDTSDFAKRTYMGIMYGAPYYFRDEEIPVPHNMFVNLAALSRLATQEGLNVRPSLDGMAFLAEPPANADGDVTVIDIRYIATRVRWEYDAEAGVYRRFSDGQPHFDANTGQQVTASNVAIIYAEHEFSDIVESEWQGNVSYGLSIKLWFDGEAVLFRDGKRYDGVWVRPTREDMIQLRTYDGELLYFKPGNTFFQVMRPPADQDPAEEGLTVQ